MGKKVVTFGEIMIRLSPPGFLRFTQARAFDVVYGGGEANVAVSLAHFGVPSRASSRIRRRSSQVSSPIPTCVPSAWLRDQF